MNRDLPPSAKGRAALEARRVRDELPEPARVAIRCRAVREMVFGEHWVWRNGAEYFTAAGLRMLADTYDREADTAAALVCRRLADEVVEQERRDNEAVPAHAEPDTYAELERRGLA